ncbi:MAG: type I-U CRISPR-associated RAMP protein Csb1/Cas7u [Acidobacteria bacterium]|nr:type I-U CRISPR-associated RAMP protein Csb1/Cas7u [Acidobacteriota bacterium]
MVEQLTFEQLKTAVAGPAAAFRGRIRLQPDTGDGGKVFPPTYAGGVYAVENRRINGEVVPCVLLDSVQSQANRMEEALQDAFLPNWRELKADDDDPSCTLPIIALQVEKHGWITSLTAPHRIHDAILRDSKCNGKRFRESDIGQAIVAARLHNATAFYTYCPTALLFGTWDSTAGEGLDSAKIPRAIVSEIIGVNITPGVRTGSRIDPLGIKAQSATIYRRTDGGWALKDGDNWVGAFENEIEKDNKGNPRRFGKGRPSDINHGNVTPDMPRFDRDEIRSQKLDRLPDIFESNPVELRYDVKSGNGHLQSHVAYEGGTVRIRDGAVKPGGVTMEYALHTWTLSLTQLRRLRFPAQAPKSESEASPEEQPDRYNHAVRTVLAALALYALALQNERGYWLRSRCELIPEGELKLELLRSSSSEFSLGSAKDVREKLLEPAIEEAEKLGLIWEKKVVCLTLTEELKKLVELSDVRRVEEGDAEIEEVTADDSAQD